MNRWQPWTTALLFASTAIVPGCFAPPGAACATDADCAGVSRCDLNFNMCYEPRGDAGSELAPDDAGANDDGGTLNDPYDAGAVDAGNTEDGGSVGASDGGPDDAGSTDDGGSIVPPDAGVGDGDGGPVDAGTTIEPFEPDGLCWNECDVSQNVDCGIWLWDPVTSTFQGRWLNTSQGNIHLREYDDQIVLDRADYIGNSQTMRAHYVGTRNGDSVSGTVTWVWNGNTTYGTWFASWHPGQGCSTPEDAGPGGSFGPPPGGWQLSLRPWNECEPWDATTCASWQWSNVDQRFTATEPGGGIASYTLAAYDSVQVIADLADGGPYGAHYVGVRIGNDVVGSVTYTWQDGGTAEGTWTAAW